MVVIARQFLPEEGSHKTSDSELSVKVPPDEFYGELNTSTSEIYCWTGNRSSRAVCLESHRKTP